MKRVSSIARQRKFALVDSASGEIVALDDLDDVTPRGLAAAAEALDRGRGRVGWMYSGYARNPRPGTNSGYYVYRCAPSVGAWECLGFVETVPVAVADRVWIEARAAGFVVYSTTDDECLTVSPISLAEAQRIALDVAERTGAHYDGAR